MNAPELILYNGRITTLDPLLPEVSAVAFAGGRITAEGGDDLLATAGERTERIDLKGRRVVPGLAERTDSDQMGIASPTRSGPFMQ